MKDMEERTLDNLMSSVRRYLWEESPFQDKADKHSLSNHGDNDGPGGKALLEAWWEGNTVGLERPLLSGAEQPEPRDCGTP